MVLKLVVERIEYFYGFQYKAGVLQFFPTAEGYVNRTGNTYNYIYNYTDHLGNVRVSYTKDPLTTSAKIVEENHYYPFGLKHANYNSDQLAFQPNAQDAIVLDAFVDPIPLDNYLNYEYKYNGKELQREFGLNMYDYGARNYDPAIGRWMNMDPLAENHHENTPYMYANNNPIIFVDPDGMDFTLTGTAAQDFARGLQARLLETEMSGKISNYQNNENDDIIFKNNKGTEIGRIVTPGDDYYYTVNTDFTPKKPIVVDPQKILKEFGAKFDAVGLSIDYAGVLGGGMIGGFDFTYIINGKDAGNLYGFKKIGGGVGLDGAIGASPFISIFNQKSNQKLFSAAGMEGVFNGYSGGYGLYSGSYSWGNIGNEAEIYPTQKSRTTWSTISFGSGLGGEVGGKWLSGTSTLMNNGKPLFKSKK